MAEERGGEKKGKRAGEGSERRWYPRGILPMMDRIQQAATVDGARLN